MVEKDEVLKNTSKNKIYNNKMQYENQGNKVINLRRKNVNF